MEISPPCNTKSPLPAKLPPPPHLGLGMELGFAMNNTNPARMERREVAVRMSTSEARQRN